MGDGPKQSTNHHYSNHSHNDNSFSMPSTSSESPDLRDSLKSNSEAVIKFKGQEVRAGVVNLTIKVKCNCGSLTPSTKRKLTARPRVAAAVAEEDDKSQKQLSSTTNVVRIARHISDSDAN